MIFLFDAQKNKNRNQGKIILSCFKLPIQRMEMAFGAYGLLPKKKS
jgi:hypothetical protein